MTEQQLCQHCDQKKDCQEAYRQLGSSKAPPVAVKVVVAFLLPMVVFIAAVVIFEKMFAKTIDAEGLRTAFSFLLALSVTFALILIIKLVIRRT